MDKISSQKLISEIFTLAYRLDILIYVSKDSNTNEIKSSLIKVKDRLQDTIDLVKV